MQQRKLQALNRKEGMVCRLLKERQGSSALVRFERALMLAKYLGDLCQERRATRGLAAAARLQVTHWLSCTPHPTSASCIRHCVMRNWTS